MKLSAIQIVSSPTSMQNPIGTTFGIPSFEAVATGNTLTDEKAAFISSVSLTMVIRYLLHPAIYTCASQERCRGRRTCRYPPLLTEGRGR